MAAATGQIPGAGDESCLAAGALADGSGLNPAWELEPWLLDLGWGWSWSWVLHIDPD